MNFQEFKIFLITLNLPHHSITSIIEKYLKQSLNFYFYFLGSINHVINEANSLTHDIAQWTIVSLLWGLISISLVPFSLFKSRDGDGDAPSYSGFCLRFLLTKETYTKSVYRNQTVRIVFQMVYSFYISHKLS